MIGYVTLGTNDMARAKGFYDALLAPLGALRWLGRGAVALWAAGVVAFALNSAYRDTSAELGVTPVDLAALPAVFAAMHLLWGLGFLVGLVRFAPPVRALRNLLGGRPV